MYRRRVSDDDAGTIIFVGCLILAVLVVFALSLAYHREHDRTVDAQDMDRILVLRVYHGDVTVELLKCDQCPGRRGHEARLREITAEHNAILARHPTWTVQPLDTRVLIR